MAAWFNGVWPSEIKHLAYSNFPSSQLLTEDIHKQGQPPYLVVDRNDVIEYTLAKYPCSVADYWKHVDQRQRVTALNTSLLMKDYVYGIGKKSTKDQSTFAV